MSATAVTGTPLIEITGTGSTPALAQRLAAAGAQSLISYMAAQTKGSAPGARLLSQYTRASAQQQKLQSHLNTLESQGASEQALDAARVDLSVANLKAAGLSSAYTASQAATGNSAQAQPQLVTAPTSVSSDRRKKAEEFAIVGLIVGLCLGASILTIVGAGGPVVTRQHAAGDATAEKI